VEEQHSFIEAAKAKGYDVLLMDGHLDNHFINYLETKFTHSRFARVDADVIDKLIQKGDSLEIKLTKEQQDDLTVIFKSQLPEQGNFIISFEGLKESENPMIITQSEFMRRMKDMSSLGGPGMNFYGEMPDSFNLVVNSNHVLVNRIVEDAEKKLGQQLSKQDEKIKPLKENKENLEKANKNKKEEEITQEEKDRMADLDKKINELKEKRDDILKKYAGKNKLVRQLIDLALLSNNMLKGEELTKFVKRSIELI